MTVPVPSFDDIFCAAIEIGSTLDRADHVARMCGDDRQLQERVEKLLTAHFRAGSFLEAPATPPATMADEPASETAGQQIGPYKLLQKLGEGGMGAVWMADQTEPVQRRVAVKLIKAGMDSARVIARFEQERQALALMDHPNIAKVLDAGSTQAGRPYFVMELVKGVPITKFCDHEHLTPKERLELFIPVCQAVQHAHQKGVIHRDLKPSNVLIAMYDGKPVPKVIDFGVAKATGQKLTERSLFTEVGVLIGTLEYMAPEQAELNNLDIDTRADIYALGVLLYELLTGSTPFTGQQLRAAAFTEMLRMIREVEPPKPSTKLSGSEELPSIAARRKLEPRRLASMAAGDLDWIVMKCLEKDRARRYETANGLAADVHRYLADEPVLAGPPGAGYRLRKFVRRNRGPMLAASGAGVLLLTATAALAVALLLVNREKDKTLQALKAKTHALLAESAARTTETRRRQQAREALDAMSSQMVEDWLSRQQTLQLTPEQKAFLKKALAYYEEFAADTGQEESVRVGVMMAHYRIGDIQQKLGLHSDAEAAYRRGGELADALAVDFPTVPEYRSKLAATHILLGNLLKDSGRPKEAERTYRDALAILSQLAADFPTTLEYRMGLAASNNNLGSLLMDTGRLKEAEQAFRDALAMRKRLAADFPSVHSYRKSLATSNNNMGVLLRDTGRPKEAEQMYRDALAIHKQLAADFPNVPEYRDELATFHNNLGALLSVSGRLKEGEQEYRDALAIQKQLAANFPSLPEYRKNLARCHIDLGNLLKVTGRLKEAELAYRDALAIQKQLAADFPTIPEYRMQLARIHNNLCGLLSDSGALKEGEQEIRDALAIQKQLAADFPTVPGYRQDLATSHANLSVLLSKTSRSKDVKQAIRDALALQKQLAADFPTIPEHRNDLAKSHNDLGNLLQVTGQPKEAEQAYRDALAIQKQLVADFPTIPEYRSKLALSHNGLGVLLKSTGRPKDAKQAYRDALAIQRQLTGDFPTVHAYRQDLAMIHSNLGNLLQDSGRPKEAEQAYREALAIQKQLTADFPTIPEYRMQLARIHNNLGGLLQDSGRPKEGALAYRDALAILKNLAATFPNVPDDQYTLAVTLVNLAYLQVRLKEFDEARRLLEEAVPHHQAALRADPRHQNYRQSFHKNRTLMTTTLLSLRDHAAAAKMADDLLKASVDPVSDSYNAACFLSLCVPLAEKDSRLTEAERRTLAHGYADRAMVLLREAVTKGFRDAPHLAKDDDLTPLRQRQDFQVLLKELEKLSSSNKSGSQPQSGRKNPSHN